MQLMHDVCSLDYLVGTLSTAYKGVITSLAMKDFCMTEEGTSVILTGAVLSMPPGDYNASLLQQGVEFARTPLENGSFVLKTDIDRVKQARELQIDIIQNGRHIGTFLLKKEGGGGIYVSAIELSEELRGMDLKLLTLPLRDKVGLLQKAEGLITSILSAKKDWPRFSEKLDDFTRDFFWAERSGFYNAFRILAHFSLKAAERTDTNVTNKPISNFLGSIELPLEYGTDDPMLRSAVDAWLEQLESSPIRLSAQLMKSVGVVLSVHKRFPDADIGPVLGGILRDMREKLSGMPTLSRGAIVHLQNALGKEEYEKLSSFDRQASTALMADLSAAEHALKQGMPREVLTFLAAFDPDLLDPQRMTTRFYETIARNISAGSADAFSVALIEASGLLSASPSLPVQDVKSNILSIIEKLISAGRGDLCNSLLGAVGRAGSPFKEEIIMEPALAGAFLRSGNAQLIDWYTAVLTSIAVPAPGVREISAETWAEVANPLHLDRLTRFMDILQLGDERLYPVLVHVVANLYISGVFIPDDRLFQRRVSGYLNSPAMKGPFLLNFLLLQKLPVYFNEVGAVSAIRDYSTEIDSWANDPVLYFLRKQVHVNASNYNVRLIEKIIESWVFNDASMVRGSVPPDVYAGLKPGLLERYSRSIRPFFESLGVLDPKGLHIEKLLRITKERFKPRARYGQIDEVPSKVMLLCRLYQEIVKKYSLTGREDRNRKDPASAVREDVGRLRGFARAVLATGKTTPRESLYFKRHIAFGIPSVLGTYHEAKFDALGDFFRCDAGIRISLEKRAAAMGDPVEKITKAAAERRLRVLADASELLALHGLNNIRINEFAAVIRENRLYLSQAADVLRMWQKELAWTVGFFSRTFQKPVGDILADFPKEDLPENLRRLDRTAPDFINKAADIIIRNMIADVTGLMETDRMIERLLSAFLARIESTGDEAINEELAEDRRPYFDIYGMTDEEAVKLSPLLGTKAKNLVYLHNRGFRVPAGVVLSAKWIEQLAAPANAADFDSMLHNAVRVLENRTGLVFGDPVRPLLLSVRSGSYVSMPGILETILYCGMNDETVQALIKATGDPAFAWDSYRRFIEHYATSVLGLDIGVFDRIRNHFLNELGVPDIKALDAGNMEVLVHRYHREIVRAGKTVPEDAYEQLNASIRAISASWYSRRAAQFRKATKTSEHWDTSVTLMQMIPGNAAGSGASVFFTRNPFTLDQEAYGETREAATGDDLVYGRHLNRPLSKKQTIRRKEAVPRIRSLEETDPELFDLHRNLARDIEAAMGGLPHEVEATYARRPDGKKEIFVLQARRMELTIENAATFGEICTMESRVIGRGTGANGGALSGVASFVRSPDEAVRIQRESKLPVILLRATASTDDIPLMTVVRGMVTSAGGVTSHAAVLAQKFDINAVVGCSAMSIGTDERGEPYAVLAGTTVREGSFISIDGSSGLVFSGLCLNVSKR